MRPVFDAYSNYNNLLYQDKDYAAEATYVLSGIRVHQPGAAQILELGCRTGDHTVALARHGMLVACIDRSQSMLKRAARRLEGEFPVIRSRAKIARYGELPDATTWSAFAIMRCRE